MDFRWKEDGSGFLLRMFLESSESRGDGSPYSFSIDAVGAFGIDLLQLDAEEVIRLVALNSSAVLYGIVRGLITSATALGSHGPLLLPTVNLDEPFRSAWDKYRRTLPPGILEESEPDVGE